MCVTGYFQNTNAKMAGINMFAIFAVTDLINPVFPGDPSSRINTKLCVPWTTTEIDQYR